MLYCRSRAICLIGVGVWRASSATCLPAVRLHTVCMPTHSPPDSWTQENVAQLCRLADKYDIAHLRQGCALFLNTNVLTLTLTAPLASPQNLLHAASLVERYLHQVPHSTQAVQRQLHAALSHLTPSPYYHKVVDLWPSKDAASALLVVELADSAEYRDIVTSNLQVPCFLPGWVIGKNAQVARSQLHHVRSDCHSLQERIQAARLGALTTVLKRFCRA